MQVPKELIETDETILARVPLGRSRALALLGGLLLNAAVKVATPELASAQPYPCYGHPACLACSGSTCTQSGCQVSLSCPDTGQQCWTTCDCTNLYRCCDWVYTQGQQQVVCICSGIISTCGPPC